MILFLPNEILNRIFNFARYKDLITLQLTNRTFYKKIKNYKAVILYKNIVNEALIEHNLEYLIKEFKMYEYDLIITNTYDEMDMIGCMEFIFKSYFSFYYNKEYHEIKLYVTNDPATGCGGDSIETQYVCYKNIKESDLEVIEDICKMENGCVEYIVEKFEKIGKVLNIDDINEFFSTLYINDIINNIIDDKNEIERINIRITNKYLHDIEKIFQKWLKS